MLPELLEQDHRQQVGTGPASGEHMERRDPSVTADRRS
jgi:hypothetical protein